MVVVIILAVLTAMIAPHFAGTYQEALLRGTARELVTAVRLASSQAVTRNRVVLLVIDTEKHRYWMECRDQESGAAPMEAPIRDVPGAAGELDERIDVRVQPYGTDRAKPSSAHRRRRAKSSLRRGVSIPFEPDGTTEPREILLRDQEGFGLGLRVHPATARVRTVSLEPVRPIDHRRAP